MGKLPGLLNNEQAVTAHLVRDPVLKPLVLKQGFHTLELKDKIYLRLCSSIISQQLSTKVARVIYTRFLNIFGGTEPTLEQVAAVSLDTLRQIGCSGSKASYIHNVCAFFGSHQLTDEYLYSLNDDALIDLFTQIKGIGRWTAEMILMFSMGREDVFATDDLGIQKAMIDLYALPDLPKKELKKQMESQSLLWSPYRSYASLYLWKYRDGG